MEETPQKPTSKITASIVTAVILIVGAVIAYTSGIFKTNSGQTQNNQQNNTSQQQEQTSTQQNQSTQKYKDGTYTVNGSYRSPGGQEQFQLSVTLKNDIITATTFIPNPVSPVGDRMQEQFNAGYKDQVIGKNINEVSLTVVSGASLTTGGFMNALESIKQQAIIS